MPNEYPTLNSLFTGPTQRTPANGAHRIPRPQPTPIGHRDLNKYDKANQKLRHPYPSVPVLGKPVPQPQVWQPPLGQPVVGQFDTKQSTAPPEGTARKSVTYVHTDRNGKRCVRNLEKICPVQSGQVITNPMNPQEVFHLQSKIGSGSTSEVFLAHSHLASDLVAVKVLPHVTATSKMLAEIEAGTLRKLNHPNIIKCISNFCLEIPGAPHRCSFIVMPFLPATLMEYLRNPANANIPFKQIHAWIMALASALQAVHQCGMIHVDVQTANVLIDQTNKVILTDFGHCRRAGPRPVEGGNMLYAAPEVGRPGSGTPKYDMWGFGLMVTEIVTRKFLSNLVPRPLESQGRPSAQHVIGAQNHLKAAAQNAYQGAYAQVVKGCLQFSQNNRWCANKVLRWGMGEEKESFFERTLRRITTSPSSQKAR
mmetsp:Transcript_135469/g.234995  ORF Transcript_135469/g.234995 Transcript_135469/m.234995 type:complete len:424 (-) Transcript_135469:973-2244(-)